MRKRSSRTGPIASLFPDVEVGGGQAKGFFSPSADHEGQPGWVQGGFVATVLDYVCARAATETFGEQAITGTLSLRYIAPVHLNGGPYVVTATSAVKGVVALDKRSVKVDGNVADETGASLVTASGLFIRSPMPD